MPRGSKELTNARKDEIIDAAAALYETMNFKDVTLKEVGEKTSFTRTLIYYYFHTKEEIFLALMQREYEAWARDLTALKDSHETMEIEDFAEAMAHLLEKRSRLLKLMSMNHYDMEDNSRMENLIEFKKAYGGSMKAVDACLAKFYPALQESDRQAFIYAFFPFLFGIYPYTVVTDKQREALRKADAEYLYLSIFEITRSMVKKLLQ